MRILRNLNSPVGVLVVLVLFVIVNGFLLYRYQQSLQTTNGDVGTTLFEGTTSSPQGSPTAAKTTTALERGSTVAEKTTAKDATTSSQATKQASEVRVAVSVTGTTGLSVFEDRQLTFDQAVVEPGFSREFDAEEEITISAFDAGAVQVVVNGRDLGPLGESGERVTRTFTAEPL